MTKSRTHVLPFLFPEMSLSPWHSAHMKHRESEDIPESLTTLELCAGAGGQALGFEQAGIGHAALVEMDGHACSPLRLNRPQWNVIQQDLNTFSATSFKGVDIISGGLPCPPFSIAGKQIGTKDERYLFPVTIRLVDEIRPRPVMIESQTDTCCCRCAKIDRAHGRKAAGSPESWQSCDGKTAEYRLAGRVLQPALEESVAEAVASGFALTSARIAR